MKKEYKQPLAQAYIIQNSDILAGSIGTGDGNTPEQNAKQFNIDFSEDED